MVLNKLKLVLDLYASPLRWREMIFKLFSQNFSFYPKLVGKIYLPKGIGCNVPTVANLINIFTIVNYDFRVVISAII